jgi:hypothetical protein
LAAEVQLMKVIVSFVLWLVAAEIAILAARLLERFDAQIAKDFPRAA